jgi:dihydroorotase
MGLSGSSLFLEQVQLLEAPGQPPRRCDVLIESGTLAATGPEARQRAEALDLGGLDASQWWLGPALVDPHSVLEQPQGGRAETLQSLARSAAAAGYGSVALLPQARPWRDRGEAMQLPPLAGDQPEARMLAWGSFSSGGAGQELAPHGEQLDCGAIGLAEAATMPPLALLERGLRLGEMGDRPVLIAPRSEEFSQAGFVREGVEALRLGWPLDPLLSETLPLGSLLALAQGHPQAQLRLMNLSTAAGVALLAQLPAPQRPLATVSWWHLVADCGSLDPVAEGWRVQPSLGCRADREALIAALASGVLTAVAVQHQPLDAEEQLLPLDQRKPGVAGHRYVLPMLWQELVQQRGWTAADLWRVLCWGPAQVLGQPAPLLSTGSSNWILFDPQERWRPVEQADASLAANQALLNTELIGRVVATGLGSRS